MSCTLVTAFYPIRSKFPTQQYLDWAHHFLSLETPIVLFTEEHLVPIFEAMRVPHRPLRILPLPFSELETWSGHFPDFWRKQHTLNPEGHIQGYKNGHICQQTPELYALWANKAVFVERAIHENPFQTDYFFWCDIGAFREPPSETVRQRFPEIKWLPRGRILLHALSPLSSDDKVCHPDGIHGPAMTVESRPVRLVGGLWGGDREGCLAWRRALSAMLHKYMNSSRYAGNDQMVMLSAIIHDPTLAVVVRTTRHDINQWFFLEYLLSSEASLKVDLSYL